MHGLVNRSIQCFLLDTYGERLWARIADGLDLEPSGFEAMLSYDDALTQQVLDSATELLDKPAIRLFRRRPPGAPVPRCPPGRSVSGSCSV